MKTPYPRTEYKMTQAQFDKIIEACKPVPCMIVGGYAPSSPQENANRAWSELGGEMGFDGTTVEPSHKGNLFFTAIPNEPESVRIEREAKEAKEARLAIIKSLEEEIAFKTNELADLKALE